ncbi:hypothetical protein J2T13_004470 [Paenibacillus sp. DS2015]
MDLAFILVTLYLSVSDRTPLSIDQAFSRKRSA